MKKITSGDMWDQRYLAGRSVPSVESYIEQYAWRSAVARRELTWREIRYGPDPAERLHFFPALQQGSPLVIFVHGGYWQQLTEAESSFAALDIVAAGGAYAALGYGLAPRVQLDEIVAMVRRAVLWLYNNAGRLGVDQKRIVLAGHSAGAQLVGMCLVNGWLSESMRPKDLACVAMLMSGLYELEPVRHSSIGAAIGLSAVQAAANSFVRQLHAGLPPLVVARGAEELTGFADQQRWLVSGARQFGVPVTELVVAARNHFDLPLGMGDPADDVGRTLLAQVGLIHHTTGDQVAEEARNA